MYIYQISKFQDSGPLRFLITYCHFRELFLFDPRKMDGILISAKWKKPVITCMRTACSPHYQHIEITTQ